MKSFNISAFVLAVTLASCVSQSKYDELAQENKSLMLEIDELEHGAPRLLAQAQKFKDDGDFDIAREKIDSLFSRHAESKEAVAAKQLQYDMLMIEKYIADDEAWKKYSRVGTVEAYNEYLSKYPAGRNVALAQNGLQILAQKSKDSEAARQAEEYNQAANAADSYTIRQFIERHQDHPEISRFRARLIQAEVNEIFADANTSQMPQFQPLDFGAAPSKISYVSVKNDTKCSLTVRYSGNDVKIMEIAPGVTSNIALTSGAYRIAASACGSNYAGTEDLHGKYSASYYIITSSYR